MVKIRHFELSILVVLLKSLYVTAEESCFTIQNNEISANNCVEGYYLSDSSELIKCTGPTTCSSVDIVAGLYKDNANNSKYIKCTNEKICTEEDPVSPGECSAETIGKVINNGKTVLCLGKFGDNFPSVEIGGTVNGKYFVQHSPAKIKKEDGTYEPSGNVFTWEKTANFYAINVDGNSITFDSSAEYTDQCADTDGKYLTRKEDFCSTKSSGVYYSCGNEDMPKGGVCIARNQADYTEIDNNDKTSSFVIEGNGCKCSDCTETDNGYSLANEDKTLIKFKYSEESPECTIKENVIGYYWNNNKNMFKFDGEEWKEISTIKNSCESNVGGIINDNGTVKFCVEEGKSVNISSSNIFFKGIDSSVFSDETKYYAIKKSEDGDALIVDTSINGEDVTDSDKNLYSCESGKCTALCKINSVSSNSCVASNGCEDLIEKFVDSKGEDVTSPTANGWIIKVEDGQCTVTSNNGYYVNPITTTDANNTAYPLILCTGQGCQLQSKENLKVQVDVYYLGGGDTIINCQEETKEVSSRSEPSESESNLENESIIKCSLIEEGGKPSQEFYLNAMANANNKLTNGLIYCKSTQSESESEVVYGSCKIQNASPNSYYALKPLEGGDILKCETDSCKIESVLIDSGKTVNYLDAQMTNNVIVCENNGCISVEANKDSYYIADEEKLLLINCSSGTCKHVNGLPRYAYLSNNDNKIIICNSIKCSEVDIPGEEGLNAYYLNGMENKETKPLIKCDSTGCESIKVFESQTSEIYLDNSNNALILCTSTTLCSEVSSTNTNGFISIADKMLVVKNGGGNWEKIGIFSEGEENIKKSYFINPNTYEILSDNSIKGILAVCLKTSGSVECSSISRNYNNYYINGKTEMGPLIYNNNGNLNYMKTVDNGLYINDGDIIKCFDNNCSKYENPVECSSGKGGHIINGKLCSGNNNSVISLSTTEKKIIISISQDVFGEPFESKIYILSATNKRVTVINQEADGYYYYLVDDASTEPGKLISIVNREGSLYKCEVRKNAEGLINNGCVKVQNASGYYTNDDTDTVKIFVMIVCDENGKCKSQNVNDENNNYCISPSGNKSLSICTKGCVGTNYISENCNDIKSKNGYYLSVQTKKLISCSEGLCEYIEKPDIGYYMNKDLKKPLIKCSNSVGTIVCNSVPISSTSSDNYVNYDGKSIIKCVEGICKAIEIKNSGWFKGETDKGIIRCEMNGVEEMCDVDIKPKTGWYINGDNGYLIKCEPNNDKINCVEKAIAKSGYFINAALGIESKQLIKCILGGTCVGISSSSTYYINGDTTVNNAQLIYCTKSNVCTTLAVNEKGWYVTEPIADSGKYLIKCDKNKICTEQIDCANGYYINSDIKTSAKQPLIIVENGEIKLANEDNKLSIGWYVNAGREGNNDAIIRCSSYDSCNTEAVRTQACLNSAGKFTVANVKFEWCDPSNKAVSLEDKEIFVSFTNSNTIPGVTEKKGIAILEVTSNSITRKVDINGYKYDNNNNILYYCPKTRYGLCDKEEEIKDGFYVEHVKKEVLKCEAGKCETYVIGKDKLLFEDTVNNIKFKNNANRENDIVIGDNNVDYIYALQVEDFPGAGGEEYIKANIGKYYITLNATIDTTVIKDITEDGSYDNEGKGSTFEYDYDTNNGFYIIEGGKLKTVFIPDIENDYDVVEDEQGNKEKKSRYKFECKIGGGCSRYRNAEEPITGFNLTPDGVLQVEKRDSGSSIMEEEIKKGSYRSGNKFIECEEDGSCKEKEDLVDGFSISGDTIEYSPVGEDVHVRSSKRYSKFIFKKRSKNHILKRSKRSENNDNTLSYGDVLELTHVSYTYNSGTRNIFVGDKDDEPEYVMITTEPLRKEAKHGYTCNESQGCKEIDGSGAEKYYLNTAAVNQKYNSYACCGGSCSDSENGIVCKLIDAHVDVVVSNAAATGKDDALIKCSSNSCNTAGITGEIGLPECEHKGDYYVRKDNGEKLLNDQYCMLDGVPVSIDDKVNDEGIYMFDAAYKRVSIEKVNESYLYGSIYYCNESFNTNLVCKMTNGYIVNNNGYSKCSGTGCEYINEDIGTSCSVEGPGSIVMKNGKLQLCEDNENSIIINENEGKNIAIDITVEGNFPETKFGNKILAAIKKIESSYIVFNVIEDGYVLFNSQLELAESDDVTGNILYECEKNSKNCILVEEPAKGYYLSLYTKNIIECDSSVCKISNVPVEVDEETQVINIKISDIKLSFDSNKSYYYLDGHSVYLPGYQNVEVIVESSMYKMNALLSNNYILLNENKLASDSDINRMFNLFLCNSSIGKCSKVMDVKPGWYLSGDQNYKAIRCSVEQGVDCIVKKELNKSCSGYGDFIYSDNSYRICKIKSGNGEIINNKVGSIIYLDTTGSVEFPDDNVYLSIGSNAVIGIGERPVKEDDNTLQDSNVYTMIKTCSSDRENLTNPCKTKVNGIEVDIPENNYCIITNNNDGEKLYRSMKLPDETKQCILIKEKVVVLRGDKEVVDPVGELSGTQMYYCNSNGLCRNATGYKKIGSDYLKCDYNGCEKVNSSGNILGDIDIENGNIIYGNNDEGSMAEKYYYISGNNNFPGSSGKESILIKGGDDYYVIFNGDGYYLLDGHLSGSLKNESKDIIDSNAEKRNVEVLGNNGLYLCDSISMNCVLQNAKSTNLNGYFDNGLRESNEALGIIRCSRSECDIAEEGNGVNTLSSTSVSCNSTFIGEILRNKSKTKYGFCISKSTSDIFTTSPSNVKHYFVTLYNGNRFGDVRVSEKSEETETDDSVTIMVKVTNKAIYQTNYEGYILYDNGLSKDVISTLNKKGVLYYCENNLTYNNQCQEVTDIKDGWYFSKYYNDNKYIKCTDGNCIVTEALITNECKYSGSLIFNNNKFKMCLTLNKQVIIDEITSDYQVMMNVSYYPEFPGLQSNNTQIVANVEKERVTLNKLNSYLVVRNTDNKIVVNTLESKDDKGDLYKCEITGSCNKILIPNDNWYLKTNSTGFAVELIYCNKKSCKVNWKPTTDFYVSSNKEYPLIQCIRTGNEIDGVVDSEEIICKERTATEGWFKNGNYNSEYTYDDSLTFNPYPLIRCDNEVGCVESKGPEKGNGYYINAGYNTKLYGYEKLSNATIYPIIQCDTQTCEPYKTEIANTCTKGGEIIYNNYAYKICRSVDEGPVDFSKVNGEVYQIINVSSSNDFPEASVGLILVKISKYQVVQVYGGSNSNEYYYKNGQMYECDSDGMCKMMIEDEYNDKIVYEALTKNLYTGSCSGNSCNWVPRIKEEMVFINSEDNKIFTGIDNTLPNELIVYKCKKNESKKLVCKEIDYNNGYYYNNNYQKDENSRVSSMLYKYTDSVWSKAEAGDDIDKVRECTVLSYRQNVCYISYANEPYSGDGMDSKYVIQKGDICATANGKYYFAIEEINTGIDNVNCVPIPSDNTSYYYDINDKVYLIDKYGAYGINGENYISTSNQNIINGLGVRNGVLESSNPWDRYMINCQDGKCTNSKAINCIYDRKTEKCKVKSGSLNAGDVCTSSENNKFYLALDTIDSTGGNCVEYEKKYYLPDEKDARVSRDENSNYYMINGKMYKLNNDRTVEVLGQGVYIIDKYDYRVEFGNDLYNIDITKNSNYRLYICDDNGCRQKSQCDNGSEFEYIYDESKVLKCNPESHTVTRINTPGYYLNSPWNNLIKCYDNGECKEIGNKKGMEGYYKDSGNENRMIVCRREEGKFNCSEEYIISCNYKESDSLCSSKVDLLRNSYCYYSAIDKTIGKVEKLLYIENFIKTGKEGKCVTASNGDYFFSYKKSKFLGNNESNKIIKVSKDYIVSIYEDDVGYYIIDTKESKGIMKDTDFKKSRMYKCEKGMCIEEKPKGTSGYIYINKASVEKMVKVDGSYDTGKWKVLGNGCKIDPNNTVICKFINKDAEIPRGDILFNEHNDEISLYAVVNVNMNGFLKTLTNLSKQSKLNEKTFIRISNGMYFLNKGSQSLKTVNGQLILQKNGEYSHNLVPYKSTVNITMEIYGDELLHNAEEKVFDISDIRKEGYFLNEADIDGEGIAIQSMIIPAKEEPVKEEENVSRRRKRDGSENQRLVMKAILNKCTSTKKNICVNTQEGQTIPKGSVCVVTEGEFKGLYLATSTITKSSSTTNCIKYSDGTATHYLKEKTEFAGQTYEKLLVDVNRNSITPFRHDFSTEDGYTKGYFVYDENRLKFNSESLKSANAYYCDAKIEKDDEEKLGERIGYECNVMTNPSKYYLTNGGRVMYASAYKWKVETAYGYYFFNENDLPATIVVDEEGNENEDKIVSTVGTYNRNGRYLNSAVTDRPSGVMVKYEGDGQYTIDRSLKSCKVQANGVCSLIGEDVNASTGEACYDGKKLYVIDIVDGENEESEKITYCYTGSPDKLKYSLIGDILYKLDGYSIQEMEDGYYVLNENLEEFSSNYPEIPYMVVKCEGLNCKNEVEALSLQQDVLINAAGTGENRLLRFFAGSSVSEMKFMNAKREGVYCLNREGIIPDTTNEDGGNQYCSDPKVVGDITYVSRNIYPNMAKYGSNMMIIGQNNCKDSKLKYNTKLEAIEFNGEHNLNNNNRIFKFYKSANDVNKKLYLLKKDMLELVGNGLYLMKDGKPFENKEWTSLSGNEEICYIENGQCNDSSLKEYRKHQYMLNKAANGISIVSYDFENDLWRTVLEDGYYFFFDYKNRKYSIDAEDRRIYNVYEIKNGVTKEVTWTTENNGFFIFNDLYVEKLNENWEDGLKVYPNVEVSGKRKCTAIEKGEAIDIEELCYEEGQGICMVKSSITDSTVNESNCMFSKESEKYYHVVNGNIFIVNNKSYQRVLKDGLYVIDQNNLAFNSRKEAEASVYECENGKCINAIKDLQSQYYLSELGSDSIVYYNAENSYWRNVDKDGYYAFNSKGYPSSVGDDVKLYKVSDHGRTVTRIDRIQEGIKYISVSHSDNENIIYKAGNKDVVQVINPCNIGENGSVTTQVELKVGDICKSSQGYVLIKGVPDMKKRTENEYNYEGVVAEKDIEKIEFIESEKKFVKLSDGKMESFVPNGKVIIDKEKGLPLSTTEETVADAYNCDGNQCEILSKDKLVSGKRYINSIDDVEYKLVKYISEDKWKVEDEAGYYFFDEKLNATVKDTTPTMAFEVYMENGKLRQDEISEKNIIGYFFNKAASSVTLLSNNNEYWSKGMELRKCNITLTEEGPLCKSTNETITYPAGDYCYNSKTSQIYLLTSAATYTEEYTNCVYGTNENPKYVDSSATKNVLNSVSVNNRLLELTNNSVRVAKPGYYIVNQNGTIIDSNESEDVTITIYSCTDDRCETKDTLSENERIITSDGSIFEMNEEGKLLKVTEGGLFFFDKVGDVCGSEDSEVETIVRVSDGGMKSQLMSKSEFAKGVYVNAGNKEVVATYDGNDWSIKSVSCEYNKELSTCSNDSIELNIGSYCVNEGNLYIISSIEGEEGIKKCVPGNDENPLYFKSEQNKLMTVKSKSINIIEKDGYYALSAEDYAALESDVYVKSNLIKCENGLCNEIIPDVGRYLNKAPSELNIVDYPENSVEKAKTSNSKCTVNDNVCSIEDGELVAGDVCISSESLYLIESEEKCTKVESTIESYKMVNGKMYKLTEDSVTQKSDGYYFINSEGRAISNRNEYKKVGTVGYICNISGDCYLLEPRKLSYYPDYTTKSTKKYNVVKFDPNNKLSKRQEESSEGSSGYEAVNEPGIYKMDDGSYVQCEDDGNDGVSCHDIDEKGSYKTNDGEIFTCTESEEGEMECSQATEGGYYLIDNELHECEPNDDDDGLECEKVTKEGYFLSDSDGVLYECEETVEETGTAEESTEDVMISKVYGELNADGDNLANEEVPPPEAGEDSEPDNVTVSSTESTTTTEESTSTTSTTTEETTSTTTTTAEPTQTPLNVTCKPIECELEKVISVDSGDEMKRELYVCKKVENDEENKWVANEECDSGNYVKQGDYYECEDEKEDVNPTNIEKPNTEHTSPTYTATTETTTTTTTTDSPTTTTESTTTTTSATTTTTESTSTTTTTTRTTTTTSTTTGGGASSTTQTTSSKTSTSSTKSTPTSTGDGSGAQSLIRTIPSLTFYLLLFVFSFYIFI